jgi:hypothetical protein
VISQAYWTKRILEPVRQVLGLPDLSLSGINEKILSTES